MQCMICNKEINSKLKFTNHLKKEHNISSQQYYDTYLKTNIKEGICTICGKPTQFKNIWSGYRPTCSVTCQRVQQSNTKRNYSSQRRIEIEQKRQNTCLITYQTTNPMKNKQIQEKQKITNLNRYKVPYVIQVPEFKQKQMESTYRTLENNPAILEKRKQTISKVELNRTKEYNDYLYWKKCQTRLKHRNISKAELYFADLCTSHTINFKYSFYTDLRYPYFCDFYLPDYDIFVEINIYWNHYIHAFDNSNSDDIAILTKWKQKACTSKQYEHAIKVWTITDVEKRDCAKLNKLKFFELWSYKDIDKFFIDLLGKEGD